MISRRFFSWCSSAVLCAASLAATSAALTFVAPAAHAQTTVSFDETDGLSFEVKEGGSVALTVTVSSVLATSLNVSYSIGDDNDFDTADADAFDYSDPSTGVVTVAAGKTTAQLVLLIIDDDEIEPTSESFTVSLTPSAGYTLASFPTVRVVIKEGVCDRTRRVRDGILGKIRDVRDCADVTDGHLSGVDGILNLSRRDISTLNADDFSGLENLDRLLLSYNRLTTLPEGIFSDLGSLTWLYLLGNRLNALPENVFSGLVNLELLNLDRNRLTTLPATVFSGLDNLATLDIRTNGLTALPENVFSGLGNLTRLYLLRNQLTALPESVFSGLVNLELLDLDDNQLTTLPATVFSGLVSLETLDIRSNDLTALPENGFSSLGNLRDLYLQRNQLSILPAGVFSDLVSLETLDIRSNDLTALPENVFSGLGNLRDLYLQYNRLSILPAGVFSDLVSLERLVLSNNPGAPFVFSPSRLVYIGETDPPMLGVAEVRLVVDETALTTIVAPLSVEGGRASVEEIIIPKGSTESSSFTATQITSAPIRLRASPGRLIGAVVLAPYSGIETEPSEELVLDFIAPSVSDVEIVSKPVVGDAYLASSGEVIRVAVGFGEAVEVSTSISGPSLTLTVGETTRAATYVPSSGTVSALVFAYELQSGDADGDGISVEEDALVLAGAEIADVAGFPLRSASLGSHVILDAAGHRVIEDDFRLSFDAANGSVFEVKEGVAATLTVTVNATINTDLIVNYDITVDGDPNTADADASDYSAPGVVTIAAGRTTAQIVLLITDDDKIEPPRESFTVSLAVLPDYALVSPAAVRVVIKEGVCDRTQQVQNGILWRINGVNNCANVTDDGLSGVTGTLRLESRRITALKAGDFSGLGNLETLNLYNNQLSTLPAGVFSGLGNLKRLNLHNNQLSPLPAAAFSDLGNLQELYLGSNQLSTLPAGIFSGLGNLQQLLLNDNQQLAALDADVFSGLNRLTRLDLSGTGLTDLPAGIFVGLAVNELTLPPSAELPLRFIPVDESGSPAFARVKVGLAPGAPFEVSVALSPVNATLPVNSVLIPRGATQSEVFTVGRVDSSQVAVVGFAGVPETPGNTVVTFNVSHEFMMGGIGPSDVEITSTPFAGGIYAAGETVSIAVTFGEDVNVSPAPGSPSLALDIGDRTRVANFSGTLSNALIFEYVVVEEDYDGDGISVASDGLSFGGATVEADSEALVGSNLGNHAIVNDGNHRIAGRRLSLSLSLESPSVAAGSFATATLTLGNADSLTEETSVRVFLVPGPGLSAPSEVTLKAGDGDTRFRVFADFDAPPGESTLTASVEQDVQDSIQALVSSTTLEVQIDRRMIRVFFEPSEVTLTRGGSVQVKVRAVPALQANESIVLIPESQSADLSFFDSAGTRIGIGSSQGVPLDAVTSSSNTMTIVATESAAAMRTSVSMSSGTATILGDNVDLDLEAELAVTVSEPLPKIVVMIGNESSVVSVEEGAAAMIAVRAASAPFEALAIGYEIGTDGDDATADADGNDYADVAGGTVTIGVGEESATIEIRITDDEVIEATREFFRVSLTAPPEDAAYSLASPDRPAAIVVIKEGVCDRTEQVQAGILREISGVSDCADVTDEHLSGITGVLDLSNDNIAALRAGDFSGLGNLQALYLGMNSLTTLPANVFSGLDGLEALAFEENNELRTLDPNAFSGLVNLRELDLYLLGGTSGAAITLAPNLFSDLGALEWLYLEAANLAPLPAGIFEGLANLKHLRLPEDAPLSFRFERVDGSDDQGSAQLRLISVQGAPYEMTVNLSTENADLSANSVAIPAGTVASMPFIMERIQQIHDAVVGISGVSEIPRPDCRNETILLPAIKNFGCRLGSDITFDETAEFRLMGEDPIDISKPSGVSITSSPDDDIAYQAGEVIRVEVTFNSAISVNAISLARPTLKLDIGSQERTADYEGPTQTESGGTTVLPFAYTVTNQDYDLDGISIAGDALEDPGDVLSPLASGDLDLCLGERDPVMDECLSEHVIMDESNHKVVVRRLSLSLSLEPASVVAGSFATATLTLGAADFLDADKTVRVSLALGSGLAAPDEVTLTRDNASLDFRVFAAFDASPGASSLRASVEQGVQDSIQALVSSTTLGVRIDRRLIGVVWEPDEITLMRGDSVQVKVRAVPALQANESIALIPASQSADLSFFDSAGTRIGSGTSQGVFLDVSTFSSNVMTITVAGSAAATRTSVFLSRGTATVLSNNVDLDLRAELAVTVSEPPPKIVVMIGNESSVVSVEEGAAAMIAVRAASAPSEALTIGYEIGTDGDDATADADGNDYADVTGGRVTIGAGEESATIEVRITDDEAIEAPREFFRVSLTAPPEDAAYVLASPGQTTAIVVIKEGVCDRTEQVQAGILSLISGVSDCADVTDNNLSGLTGVLDLSSTGIVDLSAGDFSGLVNLGSLDLDGNQLSTLPEGIFSGLVNLGSLNLGSNQLSTLPEGMFSSLVNLGSLNLGSNQLTALPEGMFSSLVNLETLDLSQSGLTALPAGIFSGLDNLQQLLLNDNQQLAVLDADVFSGLNNLTRLDLSGTGLTDLPAGIFVGLALDELTLPPSAELPLRFIPVDESGSPASARVKVGLAPGAPFEVSVALSAVNATLSVNSVLIPRGATQSEVFMMDRTDPSQVAVVSFAGAPDAPDTMVVTFNVSHEFVLGGVGPSGVEITSTPFAGGIYAAGETVSVAVTFGGDVNVSTATGSPGLALDIGVRTRVANLSSVLPNALIFEYVVVEEDYDADGISVASDGLSFGGAVVEDDGGASVSSDLSNHAIVNDGNHRVAGRRLSLSLSLEPASVAAGSFATATLTLENADFLDADKTVQVSLASGSGLAAPDEVTLTRDDASSGFRVSADFDAPPGASSLRASVEQGVQDSIQALVSSTTLAVQIDRRVIRVFFEPSEVTLMRGGEARVVILKAEPELQGFERVAVILGAPEGLTVSPDSLSLNPTSNTVSITVEAVSPATSGVMEVSATLDAGTSSLGAAEVAMEPLAVEVITPEDFVVSFESDSLVLTTVEGAAATVVISLSQAFLSELTIAYRIEGHGVGYAPAESPDYGMSPGVVTIEAGGTTAAIVIDVNDDAEIEPTREAFKVVLETPSEGAFYVLGSPDQTMAIVVIKEGVCDRTEQVQAGILSLISGVSDCSDVTDGNLSGLTGTLDLSSTGIVDLSAGDFSGLVNLGSLDLDGNQLSTLPEGIFSGLANLRSLDLDGNQLSTLPEGIFSGLANLGSLNLGSNQLTTLLEGMFSSLVNLETLDLSQSGLTALPAGIFSGLGNLQQLLLNDNQQLAVLDADVFSGLNNLTRLDLSGTGLTDLPAGIFVGLALDELTLPPSAELPLRFIPVDESGSPASAQVKVGLAPGAPFEVSVALSAVNATLSVNSVLIPRGATQSEVFTVDRTDPSQVAVVSFAGAPDAPDTMVVTFNVSHEFVMGGIGPSGVEITSTPFAGGIYAAGETVSVEVTFGGDVNVSTATGSPGLALGIGDRTRTANFSSALSNALIFEYVVVEEDYDVDGISVASDGLSFGSAVVEDDDRASVSSDLSNHAIVNDGNHRVAGRRLSLSLSLEPASVAAGSFATATLTLGNADFLDADKTVRVSLASGSGLAAPDEVTLTRDDASSDFRVSADFDASPGESSLRASVEQGVQDSIQALVSSTTLAVRIDRRLIGVIWEPDEITLMRGDSVQVKVRAVPALQANESIVLIPASQSADLRFFDSAGTRIGSGTSQGVILDVSTFSSNVMTITVAGSAAATRTSVSLSLGTATILGNNVDLDLEAELAVTVSEPPPKIVVMIGNESSVVSVEEGAAAMITVRAASAPFEALTIGYEIGTDGDDATVDADENDYADVAGGTVTIGAGEESATIEVRITDDEAIEAPREFFRVSLTAPLEDAAYVLASSDRTAAIVVIKEGVCDRTEQVQERILREISGVSDCTDVTDEHLSGIARALSLRDRSIATLKAGDFSGLGNLESLGLDDNQLTTLPATVFSDLVSLETLDLRSNELTALPENVFSDLVNLQELNLFGNQLTTLPATVFSGLVNLENLRLFNNRLSTLPTGVFSDLGNLELLDLSSNQLSTLPTGVFSGLGNLEDLRLFNNRLSTLPTGVFSDLVNLRVLYLFGNQLTALPATVFSGLADLVRLDLDDNQLSTLPSSVFSGLGNLEELNLYDNQLSTLTAGVFSDLGNLEELNLYDNQLSTLPTGVFSGLGNLENLRLFNNRLSTLPTGVFSGLGKLDILDLSRNQLSALPTGVFSGLGNLKGLWLFGNQLSTLSAGVFSDLGNLVGLYLYNNQLITLPVGVFSGLVNLESLDLRENPGAPFVFARPRLEPTGTSPGRGVVEVKLVVDEPLPTMMTADLSAEGGVPSDSQAVIPEGITESAIFTVTQDAGAPVTLRASPGTLTGSFFGVETAPSELVLDVVGPSVSGVEIISRPVSGDTYRASLGEVIRVAVGFDEAVEVSTSTSGPSLTLTIGETTRAASYVPGLSEASTLVFAYELQVGDADDDGISVEKNALILAGAGITDVSARKNPIEDTSLGDHAIMDAIRHRIAERRLSLSLSLEPSSVAAGSFATATLTLGGAELLAEETSVRVSLTPGSGLSAPSEVTLKAGDAGTRFRVSANLDATPGDSSLGASVEPSVQNSIQALVSSTTLEVRIDRRLIGVIWEPDEITLMRGDSVQVKVTAVPALQANESIVLIPVSQSADLSFFNSAGTRIGAGTSQGVSLDVSTFSSNVMTITVAGSAATMRASVSLSRGTATVLGDNVDLDLEAELAVTVGEPPPEIVVMIGNESSVVSVEEGAAAMITVRAASAPLDALAISYVIGTDGDDATADADGNDYADVAGGTVTIGAGEESTTIEIRITDDATIEAPREFFRVSLTSPSEDAAYSLASPDQTTAIVVIKEGVCDRTEQVRDEILREISGVSDCADVTGDHLSGMGELSLSDRGIDTLKAGDFSGLGNLELLDLDGNQLTTLPASVFSDLENLSTLALSFNALTALPENVFSGFGNLERLSLSFNQLSTLPAGVFSGLGNLKSLGLGGNQLSTLPSGVFSGLSNLDTLWLYTNQLSTLPATAFSGLGNLQELYLRSNRLSTLPSGVFSGLGNLRGLTLGANQLSTLPSGIFSGLGNLESLSLSRNQLSILPPGVFSGLDKLEDLLLWSNQLSTLSADVFSGLVNLEELLLNNNQLSTLPANVFSDLGNLEELSLYDNQLSTLPPGVFSGLGNLVFLRLYSNQLSTLPPGVFSGLGNLDILALSSNQLSTLPPGVFSDLGNLRVLALGDNQLSTLPAGVFSGLGNLVILGLHNNQLSTLSAGVFSGLVNLESLVLIENPGAPFVFARPRLEPTGTSPGRGVVEVKLVVDEPLPTRMTADLSAEGGTLSDSQAVIPRGSTESDIFTVTQDAGAPMVTLRASKGRLVGYAGAETAPSELVLDLLGPSVPGVEIVVMIENESSVVSVEEGAAAMITVRAASAPSEALTIGYEIGTDGDDATVDADGNDYADVAGGTVTIGAGEESTTIEIRITDDAAIEATREFFRVSLTAPPEDAAYVLASPGQATAIVVIKEGVCDRTEQVQERILREISGVSECAEVTDEHLSGMGGALSLRNRSIATLKAGDFSGLGNLESLGLDSNQLTTLPATVFSDLVSLKTLDLRSNELTALPENVFSDLGDLEVLYLHDNRLSTLPTGVFLGLGSLEDLYLYNNQLSTLPSGIFSGLSNLVGLWLYSNQLSTLTAGVFSGLGNLEELNLYNNQLSTLTAGVFSGLGNLEALNLYNNQLSTLPAGVFSDLDNLEELNLYANQLITLPTGVFSDLGNLVFLRLYSNQLSTLPATVFSGLVSLETLWLYNNQLSTLPSDVFSGLSNLERLSLYNNQLSTLPADVFSDLSNLEALLLDNNQLSTLPASVFSGLGNLEFLDLRSNPGAPFVFARPRLELTGTSVPSVSSIVEVKLVVDETAPTTIIVPLSVDGGELSTKQAVIPKGSVESSLFTVTQEAGAPVTLRASTGTLTYFLGVETAPSELDLFGPSVPGVEIVVMIGNESSVVSVEEGAAAMITVRANPAPFEALTIGYEIGADGTDDTVDADGNDYTDVAGGRVTIGAGEESATIEIRITDDAAIEAPREFFRVSLTSPSEDAAYVLASSDRTTAIVVIKEGVCDRTEQVQAGILAKLSGVSGVSDCADVADGDLSGVRGTLDLDGRGIETLKAGDFSGLGNLRVLWLSSNALTTLPADVFSGLGGLEVLWLSLNDQLTTLPATVFSGLDKLEYLSLWNNRLTALPATVFSGLANLRELSLESNQLTTLPMDVFSGLGGLELVHLNDNNLTTLPATVFSGLGSLETLFLYSNQLTALPATVFSGLDKLEVLSLWHNRLTALPVDIFSGLENLSTLVLSVNALTTLPADVFSGLGKLALVYLNDNDLITLPEAVFSGLDSLEALFLNNNQLTTLPMDVFSGLGNLQVLDLEGNQLSVLPATVFSGLGNLQELDLSSNPGAPFVFARPRLERTSTLASSMPGVAEVKLVVDEPVPTTIEATLTVEGGGLLVEQAVIPKGGSESAAFSVTQTAGAPMTLRASTGTLTGYSGVETAPSERVLDVVGPSVSDVEIVSTPASGDAYQASSGEVIRVSVGFDEAVEVSTSASGPSLTLTIGETMRTATYDPSSSEASTLMFTYALQAGDADANGISVEEDALVLAGAVITDVSERKNLIEDTSLGDHAILNAAGHRVIERALEGIRLRIRVFLEGALE